ncbi:MAG TPA: hypothetical protein VD866_11050 [Urbifossiella sp.]|nr:hypothetical protein [Urbifossiella sp.]
MTTFNPRTRLGCEALESRETPAGDVALAFSANGLFLTGDAAANRVHVEQNSAGDVYVVGQDGTTVNGQPFVYVGRGPLPQFVADLGEGEDYLALVNVFAGRVDVRGGSGGDGLYLINVGSSGDIIIDGGVGNDTLYASGAAAGNAFVIHGGPSTDWWHADNSGGAAGTFILDAEVQF